ncbi:MAG: alpha-galactosidase [bacterium]|nr:alpha-galactosidase [bacterium]
MELIDSLEVVGTAQVYEHGWQSWSPSTTYRTSDQPWRPLNERNRIICYRPDTQPGDDAFWGEGLLAIDPGDGSGIRIYAVHNAAELVPSIKAEQNGGTISVFANGPVDSIVDTEPGSIDNALARWADGFAAAAGMTEIRQAPSIWCSWYHYFTGVTEVDMIENIESIDRLDLPVDVVQLDDGYQTAHGDWLSLTDRFRSLEAIADRIIATSRRPGIWLAPFLVFPDSDLAADHPDWLVGGATAPVHAGHNWGRDLYALDTTHPGAMEWIVEVLTTMSQWGYDFYKMDFLYAAALPGARYEDVSPLVAYRSGMRTIRNAIGESYLLGCGAPILPSVGLVDAMRISPDTEPQYLPNDGDRSQPAITSAMLTGRGRAFQHGRFWVNDPDNLIVRPHGVHRKEWADHVRNYGGLRGSSDRITDLDDWGLAVTRELLTESPTEPFVPSRGHA